MRLRRHFGDFLAISRNEAGFRSEVQPMILKDNAVRALKLA
jgi:hypothetical protein